MRLTALLVLAGTLAYAALGLARDADAPGVSAAERPAILDLALIDFLEIDPDYDAKGGLPVFIVTDRDQVLLRGRVQGVERLIVDVTLSGTMTLASHSTTPDDDGNVEIEIPLPETPWGGIAYILQPSGVVPLAPDQTWRGLWRGDSNGDLPVVAGRPLRVTVAP